jgi:hypothetical protein
MRTLIRPICTVVDKMAPVRRKVALQFRRVVAQRCTILRHAEPPIYTEVEDEW